PRPKTTARRIVARQGLDVRAVLGEGDGATRAERVLTVGGQLHAVFERLFGLKRVPELSDGHTLRLKHRPWRIARHDERAAPLGETLCPQALPRRPVGILGETAERGPRLVRLVERQ